MVSDFKIFVSKLTDIKIELSKIQPMGYGWVEYDEAYAPYEQMMNIIEIDKNIERLQILLRRYNLIKEIELIDNILEPYKDDRLYIIQDPAPLANDYAVVRGLVDYIDNIRFAYSDEDVKFQNISAKYYQLFSILKNIENSFTVLKKYPENEDEFHILIESILICSFPTLKHKPVISQQIKNFIPDTGISESKTLIEYKYIKEKSELPLKVDELFADAVGYKDKDWNNLICVIYETERFAPLDAWEKELRKIKNAKVILVKGIPNKQFNSNKVSTKKTK